MTEEVRKKIDLKAAGYYNNIEDNYLKIAHTGGFHRGAEFGYSLAEKELEEKDRVIAELKAKLNHLTLLSTQR